ncbi:hypothetical protein SBRCBS47491_003446 [Sporothrix bragantina]|uniref:Uncharacterized protein n=1 Tax=Sporothrix bragantina TaxID=671064 RepID=A0ABP0BFG4_9PEZI
MSFAASLRNDAGNIVCRNLHFYIMRLGQCVLNLDGPAVQDVAAQCKRAHRTAMPPGATSMPPFPNLGCRINGSNYAMTCEVIYNTAVMESLAAYTQELGAFSDMAISAADTYRILAVIRDRVNNRVNLTGMRIVASEHIGHCNPMQGMIDFLYAAFAGDPDYEFLHQDLLIRLYAARLELGLCDENDPIL